ncbi:MAG: SHOCT domain-containing protein [Verrucomicrobiota bacterium]
MNIAKLLQTPASLRRLLLIMALVASVTFSGCIIGNRGNATPTVGQQLTDLKKARDSGALSEDEYEAQKRKLLGR